MSTRSHNPCGSCGACCRTYIVPVCGYDVWLISTRQRLAPEEFLVPCPQNPPKADGFRLDPRGLPYGLALEKQGEFHREQPCVFLIQLMGDQTRCGIHAHRPVVCQAYPMSRQGAVISQNRTALCPPNSWPQAEVQHPRWHAALQHERMQYDIYHEVVARWNARVAAVGQNTRFTFHEYLSYLMNVYDRLDVLTNTMGESEVAYVQHTWGSDLSGSDAPETASEQETAPSWQEYLVAVREVIGHFYPEVPPQPLLARPLNQREKDYESGNVDA